MSSVVEQLNGVSFVNNNLPKLERDALAIPGTLSILDFGNNYSYPTQGAPTGGSSLFNLKTDATVDGDVSTDWSWVTPNGLRRPSGVGASRVNCGAYDLTNKSFVVSGWVKLNNVAETSFTPLISNIVVPNSNADNQFSIYIGSGGTSQVVGYFKGDITEAPELTGEVLTADTLYQLGLSFEILPNGEVFHKIYINGLRVFELKRGGTTINGTTNGIALGNRHASSTGGSAAYTYYRFALENLTQSGRTPEQFIAKDYDLNNGRFA